MLPHDAIEALHATLAQRETPETVAELIRRALPPELAQRVRAPLHARISTSIRHAFGWSSMPTVFKPPVPLDGRLAKVRELALLFLDGHLPEGDDPAEVERLLAAFSALIGKPVGANSFRDDRLNRAQRAALDLSLSRRRYDKLFRLATRLEDRLATLRAEEAKHRLLLVGKAGLAADLTVARFEGHLPAAGFVAYYAARTKLRSEFTIAGQQKPFDDLAAALLSICAEDAATPWFAVAHVFPRADVLARLSAEQQGLLLGRWFGILSETAERLEDAWRRSSIDLSTMVVRRGNDSTTWNLFAGAWNRARDHWIALIDALGMGALFDRMLPGKVMRLMAADVAAWHRQSGDGPHADTLVWAELPKPWEVLRLEEPCDRARVEAACRRHRIDPAKTGWTAPRPRTAVQDFRPTPELVHGVSIGSPAMAAFLKRIGAFSGRPPKLEGLGGAARD
jgi:hypothetical protein